MVSNAISASISRLGKSLEDHMKDGVPLKVNVDDLVPYRNQARTSMDPEALQQLARTIKKVGIIQPLLVRPLGNGKYEIVAGERRWCAGKIAGLKEVPTLVKSVSDELIDDMHLFENIHRENLNNLDLARRVLHDFNRLKQNLGATADKYELQKPAISKLLSIARGGEALSELVEERVTADRGVLATVASLEKKSKSWAKELVTELKKSPPKSDKRAIAANFVKEKKRQVKPTTPTSSSEPAWRRKQAIALIEALPRILVELSPMSDFHHEFLELRKQYQSARLSITHKHPDKRYAIVEFGNPSSIARVYRADELRLLTVA
jgi:ParB family transcriptional regulator, chromosome partitioning protein